MPLSVQKLAKPLHRHVGKILGVAGLALLLGSAAHAQSYMNVTVGGQFVPGVYGQVTFGNGMPPPVFNAQPVLMGTPVYGAPVMYLYVPPGHQRHWERHCAEYRACGRPVHFVRVEERNPWWDGRGDGRRDGWNQGRDRGHGRGDGRGEGRGEGRGHSEGHRRDDR